MHRSHKGIWFLILDGCLILLAIFAHKRLSANRSCRNARFSARSDVSQHCPRHRERLSDSTRNICSRFILFKTMQVIRAFSAAELIRYVNGTGDLPEQPILLTFDDGFYNNYSLALPLLEQYNMCAIVSVVGQFTDELAPESPHEDSYSYLTWEDLQALLDSGRVELGSHTYQMHSHTDRCGCRIQEMNQKSNTMIPCFLI